MKQDEEIKNRRRKGRKGRREGGGKKGIEDGQPEGER